MTGWSPIRIWQNSANGRVAGVAGDVDMNVFDGTANGLRGLGFRAAAPAPVEPPPPPPPTPPAYDVEATRGRLWAIKDELATNGWPRFAQAIEAAVTQSKGER